MRFLPVFLDLQAGYVLLVGHGEPARVRLRVLLAAGARIRWYATPGAHDARGLEPAELARIELAKGDPLLADLADVIAVFCAGAGEIGLAMSGLAKSLRLPVNVMDEVALSTFIFPAVVDRGDVVVAIGTGGTSPVVARRVRERIEAALPTRIGELAKFIGRFRKSIHASITEPALRRRFWERVIDGPIGALVLSGHREEAEAALKQIDDPGLFAGASSGQPLGTLTLVGAGPGDPDLLTIKALRALQDADIVFYDEAVAPQILDRVRRDAEREPLGMADMNGVVEAARAGRRVVWLQRGNVGALSADATAALRSAGVTCLVVPGVSHQEGSPLSSPKWLNNAVPATCLTLPS